MKKFWIVNKLDSKTAEILLYGFIDPYDVSASDFVKELRELEKDHSQINVRINSGGGSVFEGLAIYNAMKQSQATIHTYIDGLAASMASIIAIAGKKCYISKVGQVMTHQPSTGGYGNSQDLRKNAELLEAMEQTMCGIYASKTGKTKDDCKAKFLNGKDNWFNAEQAVAEGLVDEIYDADPIELPAAAKSEKDRWSAFHELRFAAKFTENNPDNMKDLKLSAASLAALNITDAGSSDISAIDAAIASLHAKAQQYETVKTELENLKKQNVQADVNGQLQKALDEKRITVEQKNVLATQYANKPDELKALLEVMKPFVSVAGPSSNAPAEGSELEALLAKSGEELFNTDGAFERLKELNPEAYKAKYKEYFGQEPPAAN